MDVIKGAPTPGLSYNPNEPKYWDKAALAGELERVFEICHGCRLCFNLCPSFPALFDAVDRNAGSVRALSQDDTNRVIDLCYQCKLCYVKCPYTPGDGHAFQLDFPRLLLRAQAVRKKESGVDLRSRMLSRPELVGKIGGAAPGLANWGNRQPLLRGLMESALGIHRDKILPDFHAETFHHWLARREKPEGDDSKAVLFSTCFVNYNHPQLGKDTLEVFSKNGISLSCPRQNCCGMPALEAGDVELAKKLARANVESLAPHAQAGKKILAVNPTCSYMLRKEYAELDHTPEAKIVAASTMDLAEFLFERKQQGQFNRGFRSTPGKIAYHLPCHLKAQNIGYRSRDLMRLIPGASVTLVDQCSGHDGTWAMKKEFFPLSMLTGKKAFDEMKEAGAQTMVTDCPLAAIQFEQASGTRPIHPMQVLARAYQPQGFATPVPETTESQ
jgi:glycerol-3-phosphate dehydrogenase subunit C